MSEQLFEVEAQGEEERAASAQTLLAAYIDRARSLEVVPPRRFVAVLGRAIRELVDEGIPPAQVELGLMLMAEQGERPSDLPFLTVKATRLRARRLVSAFVTEYGWPTGCRVTRGSHSVQEVYDTLGTDRPPSGWTYERPGRPEVEEHLAGLAALGEFLSVRG